MPRFDRCAERLRRWQRIAALRCARSKNSRQSGMCALPRSRGGRKKRITLVIEQGFHRAGDMEARLGYHVGRLGFAD